MNTKDQIAKAFRRVGTAGRRAAHSVAGTAGRVAGKTVDHILLTDEHVASASEGKQLLIGTEANARGFQRGVMVAMPMARVLTRGVRHTHTPWVVAGSSTVSIGTSIRTGVRELQVLTSLLSHRLEETTTAPLDSRLVEKLAVDLYLNPKRKVDVRDDRVHLMRLTRKLVLTGAFGRTTSKRAARALDAAEQIDTTAVSTQWAERQA